MNATHQLSDLTTDVFASLAEELEDALTAASRGQIVDLEKTLDDLFVSLLREAPASVIDAVRQGVPDTSSPEAVAYVLGQLSFGQTVAAQAADRRADDGFVDTIHSPKFRPYVSALERQDMNGVQLAAATRETEETVSRKLKELRAQGIADFRREGTSVVNFLTLAARQAFVADAGHTAPVGEFLMARMRDLDPHLRTSQTFARLTDLALSDG